MDLENEVIEVDDSDVEFVGEEEVVASSANTSPINKIKNNKKNTKNQSNLPSEPMDTEDILPKNNLT